MCLYLTPMLAFLLRGTPLTVRAAVTYAVSACRCAMGVCGIVLTAIGSTLDQLAVKCGTTALKVSTVFLARGAG